MLVGIVEGEGRELAFLSRLSEWAIGRPRRYPPTDDAVMADGTRAAACAIHSRGGEESGNKERIARVCTFLLYVGVGGLTHGLSVGL